MYIEKVKEIRKNIKDKIKSHTSLLKNNIYHSTREELHRSLGQIMSVKKHLLTIKKIY